MSKTMTASEFRVQVEKYDGQSITELAKTLIGYTIVADPEPRPKFLGDLNNNYMGIEMSQTLDWIKSTYMSTKPSFEEGSTWSEEWLLIAKCAHAIADLKGMK